MLFRSSKEENIPFKGSQDDTVNVVFYHDISGVYSGDMNIIDWIDNGVYVVISRSSHALEIKEISFNSVLLEDISNRVESNAEAELKRYDANGGYLAFLPHTMSGNTGPDSAYYSYYFNSYFNGRFYYHSDSLTYFMYYINTSNDTVHQVFEGRRLN